MGSRLSVQVLPPSELYTKLKKILLVFITFWVWGLPIQIMWPCVPVSMLSPPLASSVRYYEYYKQRLGLGIPPPSALGCLDHI